MDEVPLPFTFPACKEENKDQKEDLDKKNPTK